MSEQEPFEHERLADDSDSFRLLRLLPRSGLEVRCELWRTSVLDSDVFEYQALSYVWGSSEKVELISLNSKEFWITENLHAALLQLALPDKDRVLWVDGICIDQSNNAEKSQQVRLMGNIFSRASGVIFWLGKLTAEARVLMDCLHRLSLGLPDHRTCTLDEMIPLWCDIVQHLPSVLVQAKAGLEYLLERPWFRRVWILQEVANAQRAMVCVGFSSVSAHVFALAPHSMGMESALPSAIDLMSGSSEQRFAWGRNPDLCTLLGKSMESEATDPRDKIFALLGMARDCDRKVIVVDYDKPTHEVYQDTLQYMLRQKPSRLEAVLDIALATPGIATVAVLLPVSKAAETKHDCCISCDPPQCRVGAETRHNVHFLVQATPSTSRRQPNSLYDEVGELHRIPSSRAYTVETRPSPTQLAGMAQWGPKAGHVRLLYLDQSRWSELLSWAVRHGFANIIELMGGLGLVQPQDFMSLPPGNRLFPLLQDALHSKARDRATSTVMALLDIGVDPNNYAGGQPPLAVAVRMGNAHVIEILLDRGADINLKFLDNEHGFLYTALEWAVYNRRCDYVELMLRHAMGTQIPRTHAKTGRIALHHQHDSHCTDAFLLMLEYGTEPSETMAKALWALGSMSSLLATPILESALKRGADANYVWSMRGRARQGCRNGMSMLQRTIRSSEVEDPIPHMKLLLDHGADINLINNYDGCDTVLQSTVREGCLRCMSFLLEHGAHIDEDTYASVHNSDNGKHEHRRLMTDLLNKQYDSCGSRGDGSRRGATSKAPSDPAYVVTRSTIQIPNEHDHMWCQNADDDSDP